MTDDTTVEKSLLDTNLDDAYKKLELAEVEQATKMMESMSLAQEDPDEASWVNMTDVDESDKQITAESLDSVRKKSRQLVLSNPNMRGIVRNYVKYIIGHGMDFRPVVESKKLKKQAKEAWRKWCKLNKWSRRQKEIVKRGFRDGEIFLRFFSTAEGLKVRFIDPELIDDPDGKYSYGIQTDPVDSETTIKYWVKKKVNDTTAEPIDASEIQHIKLDVDENVKRGIPYLYCLHKRLRQYDTWLDDRIVLNKIRSAIALLRQHSGSTPAEIKSFADSNKSDEIRDSKTGVSIRRQRIRGGTIIDAPKGVEYKYLTPNVDARDVAQDGRAILLSVAAGSGQAEYMVSGDASNSNYASTMVSEAPPVKDFEDWQQFFAEEFELVWTRVMEWYASRSIDRIQITQRIIDKGVNIVPSRLVSRDRLDEIKGNETLMNQRVMSPQTASQMEGLDYDKEQENWNDHEAEIAATSLIKGTVPPGDEEQRKEKEDKGKEANAPQKGDGN